jgi:hypothetical protein
VKHDKFKRLLSVKISDVAEMAVNLLFAGSAYTME